MPKKDVSLISPESHNIKIVLFKGRRIRKTIHNDEWWFAIVDVVAALTDSVQPDGYIVKI